MANRGLGTALAAVGIAQVLKIPFHYMKYREWKPGRIVGAGGMPSSHSSGVTALAVYTAMKYGAKTPEFAIASMLGIVVMHDAMNIRKDAGEIAMQVNDLDAEVEKLACHHSDVDHKRRSVRLRESLGHQPKEVAAGALLGAIVGALGAITSR